MTEVPFSQLNLPEKLARAVAAMGFETATPVQAQTIPLIRSGADVTALSQTGTGKTVAFALPALECIDTEEAKPSVQVLIVCPTRELAQQAGEELEKLAKFTPGIRLVELYGGTGMDRQFIRLRRANLIIGTPGRIMDHMRRKTLKLDNLKMVVLDEADEMLNMGFKEDIETILADAPAERQTILFSATMPPAIKALAKQFQREPQLVEIDKGQVTIQLIEQSFVDVPSARKVDALTMLLRYHRPNRGLIFCNTKRMVDELTDRLTQAGFAAEGLHGDLNQGQRTGVMNGFKQGRTALLIATDVAARGIDVNDLDYVFNFDIPMTTEYYVHRIGRTGRAGKSGCAITICSGKRQTQAVARIAREVKSEITRTALPTPAELKAREGERMLETVAEQLAQTPAERYVEMVRTLVERGHTAEHIAAALLAMQFPEKSMMAPIPATRATPERTGEKSFRPERMGEKPSRRRRKEEGAPVYTDIFFDVGSSNRVSPNHLVGAITELSGISGKMIGKIQIFSNHSVVGVPSEQVEGIMESMRSCKVCGKPTRLSRVAG